MLSYHVYQKFDFDSHQHLLFENFSLRYAKMPGKLFSSGPDIFSRNLIFRLLHDYLLVVVVFLSIQVAKLVPSKHNRDILNA